MEDVEEGLHMNGKEIEGEKYVGSISDGPHSPSWNIDY